jgi:hypothetical protein
MTRIGFILRGAAVLASALLMILAAAGWIRSCFAGDSLERRVMWGHFPDTVIEDILGFEHGAGEFAICHARLSAGGRMRPTAGLPKRVRWANATRTPAPVNPHWRDAIAFGIGGYGYVRMPMPPEQGIVPPGIAAVCLPYWFVVALTSLAPTWWLLAFRRRRVIAQRIARGCCRRCGYDLRASPGGVCPECGNGAPVTAAPPAGM